MSGEGRGKKEKFLKFKESHCSFKTNFTRKAKGTGSFQNTPNDNNILLIVFKTSNARYKKEEQETKQETKQEKEAQRAGPSMFVSQFPFRYMYSKA